MSSYGDYPQQAGYGQQSSAGPPGYGQQPGYPEPYGYGGYGGGPAPTRPAGVTTAAVLGFILGALAVVAAILLFAGGGVLTGVNDGGTDIADALSGVFIIFGLVVLVIAVIMIWGSVLALTGRSRVLLIVGASLLTAFGVLGFFNSLGSDGTPTPAA